MKKELKVQLKDGTAISILAHEEIIHDHAVQLLPLQKEHDFPLLLIVVHELLNTNFDLSQLNDCILLQFDETLSFTGTTYCINRSAGAFITQTQSKKIVVLPLPLPFAVSEIEKLILNL